MRYNSEGNWVTYLSYEYIYAPVYLLGDVIICWLLLGVSVIDFIV